MELDQAINTRRSVRKFKSDPIPSDQVKALLGAAVMAPSWKNSQCWRFIVVDDKNLKRDIAERAVAPNHSEHIVKQSPLLLVVCADLTVSGEGSRTRAGSPPEWFMFDCALAAENIVLTATSLGIGSVIIGGFGIEILADMLRLPTEVSPVVLISLGYPAEEPTPPPRQSIESVTYHNGYKDLIE